MKASILIAALALAGCGSNPESLWLHNSGSELDLVLIDHEPPPF